MIVTSVRLERNVDIPGGYGLYKEVLCCWLPGDTSDFRIGMRLELKHSPDIWTIKEIYKTQEHYEINRKWNVGGL
jgi:hypothetical protein